MVFKCFRRKKKDKVAVVRGLMTDKENYPVNLENLILFYEALSETRRQLLSKTEIRNCSIVVYRLKHDLVESIERVNHELKTTQSITVNFNHLQNSNRIKYDLWLIDDKDRRVDYYEFIDSFIELVQEHIALLETAKSEKSKAIFNSYLSLLYTVHCDMLTIAEVHISQIS